MSRRPIVLAVVIAALLATPIWLTSTAGGASPGKSAGPPQVISESHHDTSPPLRTIKPPPPIVHKGDEVENEIPRVVRVPGGPDGALQQPTNAPVPGMPSPIQNFAGAQNTDNVTLVNPPDTNGDVGPNNYVQIVNLTYTIFNKSGTKLLGPSPVNTIWSGFGGLCQTHNDGDPVVLYDQLADRWMISQFAITTSTAHECIAISQTGDPTGAWFRYDFPYSNTLLNDYPKLGVWPDAYYMSANQFTLSGSTFSGSGVVAYERARMLQGLSARAVYFDLGASGATSTFGGLLPADLDGSTPPPAGAPNHYLFVQGTTLGDPADRLQQWDFHVDWTTPANSTFTQAAVLPVAAFNGNMCNFARNCIPQLGTTAKLDAISDRLMFRNAYRNFGTYEAEVVNHTVNVGSNRGAVRWYEVRNASTSPSLFQQGTYAGDSANTESRWMGSAALDANGDIAVGYSDSSASVHPSIRYVGRLVGDPLGTLPQGEATLITGAGSSTSTNSRWGDYSDLTVDPSDGCTFWYTQEYYAANGVNWQTRVGSFKFPSCGSAPSPPVNTSPPTISGSAVQGATLTAAPGTWTGSPAPTFTNQWQRCDSAGANCGDLTGQTGTTYVLQQADVGNRVRIVVTGTNGSGQASANSQPTAVVTAGGGIAPTTPVLDNFNRANGGAGANWGLIKPSGFAGLNVSGSAAVDSSATLFTWDYWKPATFGPDSEAYVTVATYGASDVIRLGARVSNAGTTSHSGYYVSISSAGVWTILRVDAGLNTTLATGPTQTLASGDKVAIRIVGTVVSALHFSAGNWQQVMSYDTAADATKYSNAGNLAVEFKSSTLDDFGGGALSAGGTPPVNTVAPSISGTTTVGQQLTANPGTWTGQPAPTFTYQWLRCDSGGSNCLPIANQTAQTYTLVVGDAGLKIAVTVTGNNPSGSVPANAPPVGPVGSGNSPPVNTSPPTISGSAVQGATLTASQGTWTGSPAPTLTNQWQRCDSAGANCGDLVGQTGATYVLQQADVGNRVRVVVTGTNGSGQASANSQPTAVVTASGGIGPTTPVLDNFNRANGGAGANWGLIKPSGFAGLNVSGSAAVDSSTTLFTWDYWKAATYGPDCEAYVTVTTYGASDTIRVGARVSNAGTTTASGYYVSISSAGVWTILRVDAGGAPTTLATGPTQTLASGDKVAIRIVGTVVSALHFSAGSWQQVVSYDTAGDASKYSNAGNVAVEFKSSTLDDFGGGSI